MMKLQATAISIALLTSACFSTHSVRRSTTQHELLVKQGQAGEEITYTLVSHKSGVPRVTRSVERTFEVASLGVSARDINKKLGEERSLEPWRGVLVHRVNRGSGADRGGVVRGDVLLDYDGVELSGIVQLKELIQQSSVAGAEISVNVLKVGGDGSYPTSSTVMLITLDGVEATETQSGTVPLATDVGIYLMTGLQIGTLPEDLATEMYGSSDPVVLVADSMIGSPAYLAGFRTGDKVLRCDDMDVVSHSDVSRAVLARAGRMEIAAELFDREASEGVSDASGPISLVVDGPLGPHEATLTVRGDLSDSSNLHIPILFDCESDVQRSSWSFLDFIFQFGANYRARYRRSASRSPQRDSFLSFFPLGMFEFESREHLDRYCFFWFIEFKDRH